MELPDFSDMLNEIEKPVGNAWQAVGNEGLKLRRQVRAGIRNMAIISLELIFEP